MSLSGTLQIGKTALANTQAAIQTVGNNIAGANDPNYTRQVAHIRAAPGSQIKPGVFLGTGIDLIGVERQIDNALMGRLRSGIADSEGATATLDWLKQVESVFNELTDDDLSTGMSTFFNSWSELANRPTDPALRQIVIRNGKNLASQLNDLSRQLSDISSTIASRLGDYVKNGDELASQIAELNREVVVAENGAGPAANSLRDRRDALLGELSRYVNLHTIEQDDGSLNVYIGSEPLIIGDTSFGMRLKQEVVGDTVYHTARFASNGAPLNARSGMIGGTGAAREHVDDTLGKLDKIAAGLIVELNKLHSTGQGQIGYDSVTSSYAVDDATAPLDVTAAGLPFAPGNGSFVVALRDQTTGRMTQTLVDVDLDGTGAGTSLNDLATTLNAIAGVSASVSGGRLTIKADAAGQELTFADDTSGVLASLGIGGFFTGERASDIAVSSALDDPRRLAAARNGETADNGTAQLIAAMQSNPLASLKGASLTQTYEALVFDTAAAASGARTDAEAAIAVRETLEAQRQQLSGVSMDEEAVTLLRYQRSYQGAARLIAAVDEMMQTVLQLV